MTEHAVVTDKNSKVPLPPRYEEGWRSLLDDALASRWSAGSRVLDIGSGRNPFVAPDARPQGVRYVGLDLSAEELAKAAPGSYDEIIAADASIPQPQLMESFDLAVSWQVLEHVPDLAATLSNVHSYLKPGGSFIALFSGSNSLFGLLNRAIPNRLGAEITGRVMRRRDSDQPVFPAFYDRCTASGLDSLLEGWASSTVEPQYRGVNYFVFSRAATKAYLAYENLIFRGNKRDLATHYFVVATK